MALLNPSFANAGAHPGEAADWTLTAVTRRELLAAFDGVAREGFERWYSFLSALADVPVVRAFFGNDGFEAFERAWANSAFLLELPTGRVVACTFGGSAVETWTLAAPLLLDWSTAPSAAGIVEDFLRPGFLFDWGSVGGVGLPTETFTGGWTRAVTL